ncbi:zinc finger HIT domain-containing protein 2 [Phlebotomus argentipes]|uniref:zinc finger HIT domain-containing protein 2 n=1 Tax=Phlebotomus argentipes TaxID=94469 RepID=UPI00289314C7|nr:zinc finger HIT domain-containing protein 2 [Phlebotomus argentipes]
MSSDDQCQLCWKAKAKYSCPKCNIFYCSVPCYQSQAHLQCSENFYKECIEEEMATAGNSKRMSESSRKMYEILQRTQDLEDFEEFGGSGESDLDSDDDCAELDLASRLDGVDLNDPEAVWSKLTSSEQIEFETIVHGGDITNLVPVYTPWWTESQEEKKLVQETSSSSPEIYHPEILSKIKSLKEISVKPPASCVRHNLTNILAAYAFSVRHFNGDFQSIPNEFCSFLFTICGNMKSNSNYDSDALAVESVAHEARNHGVPVDQEDVRMMKEDIEMIKKRKPFTLAALSDLHTALSKAKMYKPKEKLSQGVFRKRFIDPEGREFKELEKSRIGVHMKKIEFFLAFVEDTFSLPNKVV